MRLYSGTSKQFILDATQNIIAEKLQQAFLDNFYYPTPEPEVRSEEFAPCDERCCSGSPFS